MTALMSRLRSQRAPSGDARDSPERPIVVLVRVLLLFEAAMYSAVIPVLPHYAHTLGASKPAVGILAAAYPAGMIPGSLIGAWTATRKGVRRTTAIGLLLFAVSILAFGFATDIAALDALRFVQGTGCGFIWGGGLTWVIAVAPRHRRGGLIGSVMGAAIFGTLLGPILGTAAVTVGTRPVFGLVGAISFGLTAWTLRHPEPATRGRADAPAPLRTLIASRRILLGSWLILLEAATLGATGTLLPLRLSRFGASGVLIGATFLLASLLSMGVAGPIGRSVDRRGAGFPLCLGLTLTAVLLALLTLPRSPVLLAIVSLVALGGPLTAYTIPSISIIADATERAGIPLAVATMLLNLAWAVGETVGAPAAANLSQATSDAVPLLVLSAIMVVSLPPVIRARWFAPTPHPAANDPASADEPAAAVGDPAAPPRPSPATECVPAGGR
jgi:MFS family permease